MSRSRQAPHHDQQRWCRDLLAAGELCDAREVRAQHPLSGQRRLLDKGGGPVRGGARGAQPRNDARELRYRHVEHHGLVCLRERAPVERIIERVLAGHQGHAV